MDIFSNGRSFRSFTRGGLLAGAYSFCLLLSGCGGSGEPLPTTFDVTGSVLSAEGKPLQGGLVEFRATTGPVLTTTGEIQDDGGFTLATMVASGEKKPGAIAGTYRVTIMPLISAAEGQQHMAAPVTLPSLFEVKAEGENDFILRLKK